MKFQTLHILRRTPEVSRFLLMLYPVMASAERRVRWAEEAGFRDRLFVSVGRIPQHCQNWRLNSQQLESGCLVLYGNHEIAIEIPERNEAEA